MELRSYLAIIWRRIWIIALVMLIILLYVAYSFNTLRVTPGALRGYKSVVIVRMGLLTPAGNTATSNDTVTTAESLADTFTTGPILTSKEFMAQIVQQVHNDTDQITQKFGSNAQLGNLQNTDSLSKSLSADHVHNLVTITVNWETTAGAWAIANAIGEISVTHLNEYLGYTVTTGIPSSPLSSPVAAQVVSAATDPQSTTGTSFNRVILLGALLLAALIISIALAFFIEYLDDRMRNQAEIVQLLALPSYGTVPRAPSLAVAKPQQSGTI